MPEYSEHRYPIERTIYTQSVGRLLPHRISQIFQELRLKTWINPGQTNGVDLKVFDDTCHLILVAEILNWSIVSLISNKRKTWLVENLSSYDCKKVLIYTCLSNEYLLEDLRNHEISLVKIGYQLLPKNFYDFYATKEEIRSRRIDSRETRQDIKSKITEYMRSSNIEILSPAFVNREITVTNL